MKRRRYLYCFLAVAVLCEVCSCGKKQGTESTEVEETEVAAIVGSAKVHEYLGSELELLEKSEIEELEFDEYVKLPDYTDGSLVTWTMAETVADSESTFAEKQEVLDKLLENILEKSVISGDLSTFYDQLEVQKTVYYMNQAEAENLTLEEYATALEFESYESFLEHVKEEAEETVDKMLVTYALAEKLEVELSEEDYIEGVELLQEAYEMDSLEELLDLYGKDQVRWMIMAYGTDGVVYQILAQHADEMGIEVIEVEEPFASNTSPAAATSNSSSNNEGNGTGSSNSNSGSGNNDTTTNGGGTDSGSGSGSSESTEDDDNKKPKKPVVDTDTEEPSETEESSETEEPTETEESTETEDGSEETGNTEEESVEPGTEAVIETEEP